MHCCDYKCPYNCGNSHGIGDSNCEYGGCTELKIEPDIKVNSAMDDSTVNKTLYILKRSNGCYGIYRNGKNPENLISNAFLSDPSNILISRILLETGKSEENVQIVFTENESEFKSNLPSLEGCINGCN